MSVELRCPDCKAKLRLDDEPEPDTPIECPKCGGTFAAAAGSARTDMGGRPAAERKAAAKGKGKGKAAKGKAKAGGPPPALEEREREFMNPFLLLAMLLAGVGGYVMVASAVVRSVGAAGNVSDMIAFLPADALVARGANLGLLAQFPGYQSELSAYAPGPVQAALDGLTKAAQADRADAFTDYMMTAQAVGRVPVYAFRCKENVDPEVLAAGLSADPRPLAELVPPADRAAAPAVTCLVVPETAPGLLAGAVVYLPTRRHVLVVPAGPGQGACMAATAAAVADPGKSITAWYGDIGQRVTSGHTWVVARMDGPFADWYSNLAARLSNDAPALKAVDKAVKVAGGWCSFGKYIRFGGGVDCGSAAAARELAKAMQNSDFGKGDEVEVPRQFRTVFPQSQNKEFGEFRSNVGFRYEGSAAFYVSYTGGSLGLDMLRNVDLPNAFRVR